MRPRDTILFVLVLFKLSVQVFADPVSVRDYGAKGDDQTDDTNAFVAALHARRNVYVPEGVYRIGTVQLPNQTYLHGDGRASVIRFVPGKDAKTAINVGSSCRISDLRFTGTEPFDNWMTGEGSMEPVMLRAESQRDIEINRVQINDFRHDGILLNGCEDVRIENCVLEKLFQAMEIDSSKRIHVTGNRLREMRNHGIQFWGQANFTEMHSEDLIFANNYVFHGGSGAIWGTGARRVVMSGNIVDGAKDIGLDMEWCYDCTITGNTTKNCWNAGIALFLSCQNVAISGNSVFIDEASEGTEGRRDGIWLTDVNRSIYRKDFGHRQISITGNTIRAEGRKRHGISIGSGYDVVCAANTMQNADILDQTGRVQVIGPQGGSTEEPGSSTGVTVVPLGPEWRFATDPNDEGLSGRWFDPGFDDANWATIRSDQAGIGWEGQGFVGKDGRGYVGFAWYRAQLPTLPATPWRFAYLHFGMTDEQAWVYLSGKQVGEHSVESEGKTIQLIWDEPFGVEVTEQLKKEDSRVVALRIHNAALAGGLRRPASLILSEKPLTVSQQIRASIAAHRQQLAAGAVQLPKLLDDDATPLLNESFERSEIGDNPTQQLWSYGENGNDQWEGDTTYVVDETTHGIPAYAGDKSLYLEQFTHNNKWDVGAHPIVKLQRQDSGVVRMAFAFFPRAGLLLKFGDSQQTPAPWAVLIGKDGKVQFRKDDQWQQSPLVADVGKWNVVLVEIKPGQDTATLTLNNHRTASFPLKAGAIDQVQFRVDGYGSVLLDSLTIVHAAER